MVWDVRGKGERFFPQKNLGAGEGLNKVVGRIVGFPKISAMWPISGEIPINWPMLGVWGRGRNGP